VNETAKAKIEAEPPAAMMAISAVSGGHFASFDGSSAPP
jgi:hypothetical protein